MSQSIEHMMQQVLAMVGDLQVRMGALEKSNEESGEGLKVGVERVGTVDRVDGGVTGVEEVSVDKDVGSVSTESSVASGLSMTGGLVDWNDSVEGSVVSDVKKSSDRVKVGRSSLKGSVVSGSVGEKMATVEKGGPTVFPVEKTGVGTGAAVVAGFPVRKDDSVCEKSDDSRSETSSVEMPVKVRALPVVFGSFGGNMEQDVGNGAFRTYVRNDRVNAVRLWLKTKARVALPSAGMRSLALSLYLAGSVPDFFRSGRIELKTMAVVGDAALTLAAARHGYRKGETSESVQSVRGNMLSDSRLREALGKSDLIGYVVAPAGVNLQVSKGAATAVEAIAGVIDLFVNDGDAVRRYAVALGLLETK